MANYKLIEIVLFGVRWLDSVFTQPRLDAAFVGGTQLPACPSALDSGPAIAVQIRSVSLWRKNLLDTDSLVTAKLPFARYAEGIEMLIARKAVKVGFYPG